LTILRIAGAPLLLVIILLRLDLGEIIAAFGHIKPVPFAAAASMLTLNLAVLIIKWGYVLSGSAKATRGDLARSVIGGHAFLLATPGHVGEFSRALFIPGESKLKVMGLVLIDKASAFGVILLMSGISLALLRSGPSYLPAMGILGLLVLLSARPQFLGTLVEKLTLLFPLRGKLSIFLEGIHTLTCRRVVVLLLMSLVSFLVYSAQYCLLLLAFETVTFRVMAIGVPLVILANSLPITIGGLGIREGAAVLLFTQLGVQGSSALGATLLLFTINILIPGLCGLAFIHQIGTRPKPLTEKNP
jgi:uncharacterized membrane protein YbhN (UPF0104 family)